MPRPGKVARRIDPEQVERRDGAADLDDRTVLLREEARLAEHHAEAEVLVDVEHRVLPIDQRPHVANLRRKRLLIERIDTTRSPRTRPSRRARTRGQALSGPRPSSRSHRDREQRTRDRSSLARTMPFARYSGLTSPSRASANSRIRQVMEILAHRQDHSPRRCAGRADGRARARRQQPAAPRLGVPVGLAILVVQRQVGRHRRHRSTDSTAPFGRSVPGASTRAWRHVIEVAQHGFTRRRCVCGKEWPLDAPRTALWFSALRAIGPARRRPAAAIAEPRQLRAGTALVGLRRQRFLSQKRTTRARDSRGTAAGDSDAVLRIGPTRTLLRIIRC